MRNKVLQAHIANQVFALCPRSMDSLLEIANQDTPRAETVAQVANNSVAYEKQGNIAIISIDGGMYKKDVGGMCSSVASYDQMVRMIDAAEADPEVTTMLFRVDTPGGAVAGADEVGDKIFNSTKRTVTVYENMGASGGIWIFSASDELYATETTVLGSIGVIVSYMEGAESDVKRVSIVSKNAENKDCSLKGNCKDKIQNMLDTYESMFYARVERNTGFDAERIKTTFNNGDVIFAKEAEAAGFIKAVTTFDAVLSSLKSGTSPTASVGNKSTKISHEGADMAHEKSDSAIVAGLKSLLGIESSVSDNVVDVSAISTELDSVKSALVSQTEANSALTVKATEAEQRIAEMRTRLEEAVATGVSVETAIKMIDAKDSIEASKIALDSKSSTGAMVQEESAVNKDEAEMAYAQAFAKTLKV